MLIEIGIMTSLKSGQAVYEALKDDDKVAYVFLETGRSDNLFDDKQFGEFEKPPSCVSSLMKKTTTLFSRKCSTFRGFTKRMRVWSLLERKLLKI